MLYLNIMLQVIIINNIYIVIYIIHVSLNDNINIINHLK